MDPLHVTTGPGPGLPTGAATFLFTDIVGSSTHWDVSPRRMRVALAAHDEILRAAVAHAGGHLVKHTGDGVMAVFHTVGEAIDAAVAAQLRLGDTAWTDIDAVELQVRMGIHTGEAESRANDYFGLAVTRAARLMSAAQGGQILVSEISAVLATDAGLPTGVTLIAGGETALKGVSRRERPLQVVHEGLQRDFAPLRGPSEGSTTPVALTSIVGREDEVEAALSDLATHRLVSITGYGGVGKTRLAIAIAARAGQVVDDDVWWVDMAPVGEAAAIAHAIAAALTGLSTSGRDPLDAIIEACGDRNALVVLDDCERLAVDIAKVARSLLERCPNLRLLVTSRVPLAISGERVLRLAPLATDADVPARCPAVELFVERARASAQGFELTPDNSADVVALCRRLDGIPLAIELAAARVRSMPPGQILRRLADRFRLLENRRDVDDRHGSMLATLQWSYDLLDPDARLLFDRLSLFSGGIDLDAAEQICSDDRLDSFDVVDLLTQLVDHSMLAASPTGEADRARFHLAETFREFGRRRLESSGELAVVQGRFAQYWLAFAEEADRGVRGADEARHRRALTTEFSNLRAAHAILVTSGDLDGALRLPIALTEYAFFGLHSEVAAWIDAALELPGAAAHPSWPEAAAVAVLLDWTRGAWPLVEQHLAALDAVVDPEGAPRWYRVEFARGLVAAFRSRMEEQCDRYERCRLLAEAEGDTYRRAVISGQLAFARSYIGRDDAIAIGEAAVALAAASGSGTAISTATWGLGTALIRSDPKRAISCFHDAAAHARRVGASLNEISSETSAVGVTDRSAPPVEELGHLLERWQYWQHAGSAPMRWNVIRKIALALTRVGEHRAAALLFGAEGAATLRLAPAGSEEGRVAAARAVLDDELGAATTDDLMRLGTTLERSEFNDYVAEALRRAVDSSRRQGA